MKKLGPALAALAVGALAASALTTPASAATAEPLVTVSLQVVDARGDAIEGITVALENDSAYLELGETDAQGMLVASEDEDGSEVYDGSWDLLMDDYDDTRDTAGTTFVSQSKAIDLVEGQNELGAHSLEAGSVVNGVVKAPSGRAIKDVLVGVKQAGAYASFASTSSKGAYRLTGVGLGSYAVRVGRISVLSQFGNEPARTSSAVTVAIPGSTVAAPTVVKHQVVCTTKSFSVSSPKKGKAKLTVRASAPYVGLKNPWGKVKVKVGSKTVKTFDIRKGAAGRSMTATIKAPKGKKVTYKASYSGGDCLSWASTKSVRIKKK